MFVTFLLWTVLSLSISCVFTVYWQRNTFKQVAEQLDNSLSQLRENLDEELAPVKHVNKRAMGLIQSEALSTKHEKKALESLGEDLINQLPIPFEVIEMAFPSFAEKIKENPELAFRLAPKIMKLLENTNFENLGIARDSASKYRADWE